MRILLLLLCSFSISSFSAEDIPAPEPTSALETELFVEPIEGKEQQQLFFSIEAEEPPKDIQIHSGDNFFPAKDTEEPTEFEYPGTVHLYLGRKFTVQAKIGEVLLKEQWEVKGKDLRLERVKRDFLTEKDIARAASVPVQTVQADVFGAFPNLSGPERRMVHAVNQYRQRKGLPVLSVDPILMQEARWAAPHYNHVVGGKWVWDRVAQRGFRGYATDNVAAGYASPEEAVNGWADEVHTVGHDKQLRGLRKLNGRWVPFHPNTIGVGISGRKYIVILGRR